MKKVFAFILLSVFMSASLSHAAEQPSKKRSILGGIAYLEGRGLANLTLFPLDWFHLQKSEYRGWYGILPTMATHMMGRVSSGIADFGILPFTYPFTKYDDSVPVGMGWAEYPWQRPGN